MNLSFITSLISILSFLNITPVAAQNVEPSVPQLTAEQIAQREFAGVKFGVGISATFDTGTNDRVSAAEIVGGVVRVTDEDNVRARIMLESHFFFKPGGVDFLGLEEGNWGIGPFIALQPGTEEIIESIGFGLMVGFRRPGETQQSFNIGLGIAYDPNTQTLGRGIADGQPLPDGETNIRFLEQDQVGFLLLTSFSF